MDSVSELKEFEYNKLWFLFKCKCNYGGNKTRKALKHLKDVHGLDLVDEDNHIKIKGIFYCDCGKTFTSNQVSIVYQNGLLRRLTMSCADCTTEVWPTVKCGQRKVSDNVLALLCRWKSTMKRIKIQSFYSGRFHQGLDHKSELCMACKLGVCQTRGMIDYDPQNMFHVKNFNPKKHQVISKKQEYDIQSLVDSVVSGATSL
jgi:hypothetical protein